MRFKKKLLNYVDIQEAALGLELFLLMQTANTVPLALERQHDHVRGLWVLLAISSELSWKRSGRCHMSVQRSQSLL